MRTESLDQNRQLIHTLFHDCINPGHLGRLNDLIASDYVGPSGERGPAGFAATIQGLLVAFPDIHFTVEDVVAEPDRVVVHWSWEGTHDGPFRDFPPTHKHVTNAGVGIYEIANDKITRAWVMTDRLGFQQQIGVLPTPPVPQTQPVQR